MYLMNISKKKKSTVEYLFFFQAFSVGFLAESAALRYDEIFANKQIYFLFEQLSMAGNSFNTNLLIMRSLLNTSGCLLFLNAVFALLAVNMNSKVIDFMVRLQASSFHKTNTVVDFSDFFKVNKDTHDDKISLCYRIQFFAALEFVISFQTQDGGLQLILRYLHICFIHIDKRRVRTVKTLIIVYTCILIKLALPLCGFSTFVYVHEIYIERHVFYYCNQSRKPH